MKTFVTRISLSVLIICVACLTQAQAQRRKPAPRETVKTLETLSTRAGILKLIRLDSPDIGETNWIVSLDKKLLYRTQDDVFGSVSFHTIFKAAKSGDVVLLQEDFGYVESCVQFRLLDLRAGAITTITDRFGNCNRTPTITQVGDQLSFAFHLLPGLKPDSWLFHNGKLSQTSSAK
jgi:hypothetical protein